MLLSLGLLFQHFSSLISHIRLYFHLHEIQLLRKEILLLL